MTQRPNLHTRNLSLIRVLKAVLMGVGWRREQRTPTSMKCILRLRKGEKVSKINIYVLQSVFVFFYV